MPNSELQTTVAGASSCEAAGEAYLAEDVTVGRLVRWIDREHMKAARETPPNIDNMREMQRLGEAVESALASYRRAVNKR